MGKRETILLNNAEFPSRNKLEAYLREILDKHKKLNRSTPVTDLNDDSMLRAYVKYYDETVCEPPLKGQYPIDHFEVAQTKGYTKTTYCFWIHYDPTWSTTPTAISIYGARSQDTQFSDACRREIDPYIERALNEQYKRFSCLRCEETGQMLSRSQAQLDHSDPPFWKIVEDFRRTRGWEVAFPAEILSKPSSGQHATHFVDDEVRTAFIKFHNVRAVMRVVSAGKNMEKGRKAVKAKHPIYLHD